MSFQLKNKQEKTELQLKVPESENGVGEIAKAEETS